MSKLSLIFQIIKESIFKPKLMLELAEEKSEINDDQKLIQQSKVRKILREECWSY